eukprot:scaffold574_cov333-Pavlova_lutheri.AAC.37
MVPSAPVPRFVRHESLPYASCTHVLVVGRPSGVGGRPQGRPEGPRGRLCAVGEHFDSSVRVGACCVVLRSSRRMVQLKTIEPGVVSKRNPVPDGSGKDSPFKPARETGGSVAIGRAGEPKGGSTGYAPWGPRGCQKTLMKVLLGYSVRRGCAPRSRVDSGAVHAGPVPRGHRPPTHLENILSIGWVEPVVRNPHETWYSALDGWFERPPGITSWRWMHGRVQRRRKLRTVCVSSTLYSTGRKTSCSVAMHWQGDFLWISKAKAQDKNLLNRETRRTCFVLNNAIIDCHLSVHRRFVADLRKNTSFVCLKGLQDGCVPLVYEGCSSYQAQTSRCNIFGRTTSSS